MRASGHLFLCRLMSVHQDQECCFWSLSQLISPLVCSQILKSLLEDLLLYHYSDWWMFFEMSCQRFYIDFFSCRRFFFLIIFLIAKNAWVLSLEFCVSSDSSSMFLNMRKTFLLFIALQIWFLFLFKMSIIMEVDIFSLIKLFHRWRRVLEMILIKFKNTHGESYVNKQ